MSTTSFLESLPLPRQRTVRASATPSDRAWKPIYLLASLAAVLSVGCVAIAIVVYSTNPPPTTVVDWFAFLHTNGLIGLLDLDLMMLVSYALMGVIYLALYGALRRVNEPFVLLATVTGFVSITTYFASNPAFNMLLLSDKYAAATSAAERAQLLAAGQSALASWQGTAYDVSYVLGAVPMLILAVVMLRSTIFSRATAYVGIAVGVLMLLPATAGPIGLVVAFVSLVPLVVWLILIALRFFQLASASPVEGADTPNATYSLELRLSREERKHSDN